jgi:regulator of cell morphogenesis and NO signaling
MNTVDAQLGDLSVNEVVRRWPATVEVFNRHGIDACCGGAAPVCEAAVRDGASADAVLAELRQVVERA